MSTIDGTTASESLTGTSSADLIAGQAGSDLITGGGGDDVIFGEHYIIVRAKHENTGGAPLPSMLVSINQTVNEDTANPLELLQTVVSSSTTVDYYFSTSLRPDQINSVYVKMVEDFYDEGLGMDTNLYVEYVKVGNQTVSLSDPRAHWSAGNQQYQFSGTASASPSNASNDTLDGGSGSDTLYGGDGDDVYRVDVSTDVIVEYGGSGSGFDVVNSTAASYVLSDNVEVLNLVGTTNQNGTGSSTTNTINGNALSNVLSGMDGDDTLLGNDGADTLFGGDGGDRLMGGAGNDRLVGDVDLEGDADPGLDDILMGGSGVDTLIGGSGNDLLIGADVANFTTAVTIRAANISYGTPPQAPKLELWIDSVFYESFSIESPAVSEYQTSISLPAGYLGRLEVRFVNDAYSKDAYDANVQVVDVTINGQTRAPQDGNGDLYSDGAVGFDYNTFIGATIPVSADAERLVGGTGDDTYLVTNLSTVVVERSDVAADGSYQYSGIDKVVSTVNKTLEANVEILELFQGSTAVLATGNALDNTLIGNSLNNTLSGLAGDDILIGGLGNDTMNGGAGNDLYYVDSALDVIIDSAGTDSVISTLSTYTLTANLENLELAGNAVTGIGNDSDNILTGNLESNLLVGGIGNDVLSTGGGGQDTLEGGAGDDIYLVTQHNPSAANPNAEGTIIKELAGQGTDTVYLSGIRRYILPSEVENVVMSSAGFSGSLELVANAAANDISGSMANDDIKAGLGDDTVNGSFGDDFVFGEGGADLLLGGEGADWIVGGAGTDTMYGEGGSDTLIGEGDDIYDGGTGDDIYTVTSGTNNISITEALDAGIDRLNLQQNASSVVGATLVLMDNIENLGIYGGRAMNLIGNVSANEILAGAGSDTVDGGLGDDTISGDLGNDLILGGQGNDWLLGGGQNDTLEGGEGNDLLDGEDGIDVLRGGVGDDQYDVIDTSDIIEEALNEGIDTINILANLNSYSLSANVENVRVLGEYGAVGITTLELTGNDLANHISAYTGADTLRGGAGADTLDGGLGADLMVGGTGGDVYIVDDAGDVVSEEVAQGRDTVQASITYVLSGTVEDLVLTGDADINGTGNGVINVLIGNSGNNILSGGAGRDVLYSSGGTDTLIGGADNDTYYIEGDIDMLIQEGAAEGTGDFVVGINRTSLTMADNIEKGGMDALDLDASQVITFTGNTIDNTMYASGLNDSISGLAGADTIFASNGNDTVLGGEGDDRLYGEAGDDSIVGGAGLDLLDGGEGNDTLSGGSEDAFVGGAGNDVYQLSSTTTNFNITESANGGIDLLEYRIVTGTAAGTTLTLAANVENLEIVGSTAINVIGNDEANAISGGFGQDTIDGGFGADTIFGGWGNDLIIGGAGNDLLAGTFGNDTILGGEGDDLLDGEAGADVLRGGLGNDQYDLLDAVDLVEELANEGTDTVNIQGNLSNYALGAHIENARVGNVYGLADTVSIKLVGNELANQLEGHINADTLEGGANNDTLIGFGGDDTYVIADAGDVVVEQLDGGTDTLLIGNVSTYTLADHVEVAVGQSAVAYTLTGNDLGNSITGASQGDLITGGSGNDTLAGGAGNDSLSGGQGDDQIFGGDNDDQMVGDEGSDYLAGGAGADVLVGQFGNDTLVGGLGDDTYWLRDAGHVVKEDASAGTDTVFVSLSAYDLADNVEAASAFLAPTAVILGGNGLGNTLTGASLNDGLFGRAGSDTLIGNSGDDVLDGGADTDSMVGGNGSDTYYVDLSSDVVTEGAGLAGDIDRVWAQYNGHALANNVEVLELATLAGVLSGSGNLGDNLLRGNQFANTLNGLGGNDTLNGGDNDGVVDTLVGGTGNDTYFLYATGTDTITELNGTADGTDTVYTIGLATHALGASVENAAVYSQSLGTFGTATRFTGNALRNQLTGGSGSDTLDGGAESDTLWGGLGSDSLIGGTGNDVLRGEGGVDTLVGGAGNDTYYVEGTDVISGELATTGEIDWVYAASNWSITDASNLEHITLEGAALTATGNKWDNRLEGNSSGNTLTGNAGADSLYGMDGSDNLLGGAGNDRYEGGAGNDTLTDTATSASADAYFWGLGQGADTLADSQGASIAGTSGDSLSISGVLANQVWFTKVSGTRDLKLSLIGATDSMTIKNWFSNTTATSYTTSIGAIETLSLANGAAGDRTLTSANVINLVSAMAGNVPASTAAISSTVQSRITQYWV